MSLEAGRKLAHYEILEPIGKGGMGEVYRARDTKLDREVAVKVLSEEFAQDDERLARFEREAKLLASLNHPNIASIHGFEESDGVQALVLELVEGPTLAERIQEGPIPVDETVAIARQIAEALEAGHEAGVIHRDVKPANVKIKEDGTVKVLDYGLAKALEGDASDGLDTGMSESPTMTRQGTIAGMILGTAAYMSPEQAKGKRLDRRTDTWSFGAVLFEMLTVKRAFGGEDVSETLAAVIHGEPDWGLLPGDTGAALTKLLKRALTCERQRRLQAIGEARIQLEDFIAEPRAGDEPPARETRSQPWWRAALPWGLAAIFGLALLVNLPGPDEPRPITRLRLHVPRSGSLRPSALQGASVVLSPDGRSMIYAAGNPSTLFMRPMDQLSATELAGTEGGRAPFFSPDGEWIGFFAEDALKKVSVRGGTPITLCESSGYSRSGSWGDRGTILFHQEGALLKVPAGGGSCEVAAGSADGLIWPQWLPGEASALVTSQWDVDPRIEVMTFPDVERKVVQEGGTYGRYVPSGDLVHMRGTTLYAAPFDLRALSVTGTPVAVVQDVQVNLFGSAQFAFSMNGSLVYLAGQISERGRLVWVERDGTKSLLDAEPDVYSQPRVSPDGARVAVTIGDSNMGSKIWIYDLERGVLSRLTFSEGSESHSVWSPDGAYVAFGFGRSLQGTKRLYRQRADGGGEAERLFDSLDGTRHEFPTSWSSEGNRIAFTMAEESAGALDIGIGVFAVDGNEEPERFLQTPSEEDWSAFSPDGRFLAYESPETGQYEVYVRPYPRPGSKWQVSAGGGSYPVFSPKGDELFYWNAGRMMAVHYVAEGDSFAAERPTVLFSGEFVGNAINSDRSFDVSPDGQRFLMIEPSETPNDASQLILVQNWFEELERLAPPDGH